MGQILSIFPQMQFSISLDQDAAEITQNISLQKHEESACTLLSTLRVIPEQIRQSL